MDKQKKFLGARIEPEILQIIDGISKERNIDRTTALKVLVTVGWKGIRLEKAINLYKERKISVDKAASIAGLTVSEMMDILASRNIKSDETIEEYRQGLKLLED